MTPRYVCIACRQPSVTMIRIRADLVGLGRCSACGRIEEYSLSPEQYRLHVPPREHGTHPRRVHPRSHGRGRRPWYEELGIPLDVHDGNGQWYVAAQVDKGVLLIHPMTTPYRRLAETRARRLVEDIMSLGKGNHREAQGRLVPGTLSPRLSKMPLRLFLTKAASFSEAKTAMLAALRRVYGHLAASIRVMVHTVKRADTVLAALRRAEQRRRREIEEGRRWGLAVAKRLAHILALGHLRYLMRTGGAEPVRPNPIGRRGLARLIHYGVEWIAPELAPAVS